MQPRDVHTKRSMALQEAVARVVAVDQAMARVKFVVYLASLLDCSVSHLVWSGMQVRSFCKSITWVQKSAAVSLSRAHCNCSPESSYNFLIKHMLNRSITTTGHHQWPSDPAFLFKVNDNTLLQQSNNSQRWLSSG